MGDQVGRDLRELLGAHEKYWTENRGAADHIVYEFDMSGRQLDSNTIGDLMSSAHGRHVAGMLLDTSRATARVRYTHDPCDDPRVASEHRDRQDIGPVNIAGVDGANADRIAYAARTLAACTATGVHPSFEVEMGTNNCRLFACGASQWCGLSLHRCDLSATVHIGDVEVSTVVELEQRNAKRARR